MWWSFPSRCTLMSAPSLCHAKGTTHINGMKKLKPTQQHSVNLIVIMLHLPPGPHPMNIGVYKMSDCNLVDSTSYPGHGPLTSSGLPLCRFVTQMPLGMKSSDDAALRTAISVMMMIQVGLDCGFG